MAPKQVVPFSCGMTIPQLFEHAVTHPLKKCLTPWLMMRRVSSQRSLSNLSTTSHAHSEGSSFISHGGGDHVSLDNVGEVEVIEALQGDPLAIVHGGNPLPPPIDFDNVNLNDRMIGEEQKEVKESNPLPIDHNVNLNDGIIGEKVQEEKEASQDCSLHGVEMMKEDAKESNPLAIIVDNNPHLSSFQNDVQGSSSVSLDRMEQGNKEDGDEEKISLAIVLDSNPYITISSPQDRNEHDTLDTIVEEDSDSLEINPLALVLDTYNNEDRVEEKFHDPLEIVYDTSPMPFPHDASWIFDGSSSSPRVRTSSGSTNNNSTGGEISLYGLIQKEEDERKLSAQQRAKLAKINNWFQREVALIDVWENEQLHHASSELRKLERKLEEKRAKAMEKMQNDIAKAHRKAEERRASAEAKRGTKVAKVLEVASLMRAVGRPPAKRSFF